MNYYLFCFLVFCAAYCLNIFYITVLYHRGLAHESVKLKRWAYALVRYTGNWVTGIDPKAWACLHRLHHQHSDTKLDPHSPVNHGIFGVAIHQVRSYERALVGLARRDARYMRVVSDLEFPVNWMNRRKVWWLPHLVHAVLALSMGVFFGAWVLGAAYWLGMMSHPVQGWMVNSFAHQYGYRNFDTNDHSTNNTLVAWFVMGEGYQNNHHAQPNSPKFSKRWFEFDGGYVLCLVARSLGLLEFSAPKSRS